MTQPASDTNDLILEVNALKKYFPVKKGILVSHSRSRKSGR